MVQSWGLKERNPSDILMLAITSNYHSFDYAIIYKETIRW